MQSQSELDDGIWKKLQELTKLRSSEKSLQFGATHYGFTNTDVFSYTREHEGNSRCHIHVHTSVYTAASVVLLPRTYKRNNI